MSGGSKPPGPNDDPRPPGDPGDQGPLIYHSHELFQGRREIWIEHGDQLYRLRVTSGNKLYLTK